MFAFLPQLFKILSPIWKYIAVVIIVYSCYLYSYNKGYNDKVAEYTLQLQSQEIERLKANAELARKDQDNENEKERLKIQAQEIANAKQNEIIKYITVNKCTVDSVSKQLFFQSILPGSKPTTDTRTNNTK